MVVVVTTASVQDRDGAKLVLARMKHTTRLQKIWADGGYAGQQITWVRDKFGWNLEIRKRPEEKDFHLIKLRWIVERTFGWLGRYRLLAKDNAATIASSEAEIHLAMTHLMLNRLTHQVPETDAHDGSQLDVIFTQIEHLIVRQVAPQSNTREYQQRTSNPCLRVHSPCGNYRSLLTDPIMHCLCQSRVRIHMLQRSQHWNNAVTTFEIQLHLIDGHTVQSPLL